MTNEPMDEAQGASGTLAAMRVPLEKDEDSHSTRNGLVCVLVVAAAVLITNPRANMPFGDDFSYTKTALDFARTGHFLYNGWATAMLGWLIPWGALFIEIFGFSFTVVRLSMLPIDMVSVYLFHQILRRFGINPRNAMLGALTMALSPLFLPMAASFMTDIPGLFVILVCIYMCQRAVAAQTDRAALLWLCSAMLLNVAGGTVRQIAWLGALVMVPSTAWLLRGRRGMKTAGILLWVCSLIGALACLHWFNRQPYSVPEHIVAGRIHFRMLVHLAAQLLKTFLCLLLVIFPISVAWLPTVRRLNRNAWLRLTAVMILCIALSILAFATGRIDTWLMPWLIPVLEAQALIGTKLWMTLGISLLVIAPAFLLLDHITIQRRNKQAIRNIQSSSWIELAWILGPFSISYVLLLVPRATFTFIQDRYLLGLVPTAIVVLLKLYQEQIAEKFSIASVVTLALFSVYAVGSAHDLFAECRALVRTVQKVESAGVARKSIHAGMASDGWFQVENGGHINDSRITIPAGAYNPDPPELSNVPDGCINGFTKFTPEIVPKYFLFFSGFKDPSELPPPGCYVPTDYPPVHYPTWLPPFHRTLYVQQLKNREQ